MVFPLQGGWLIREPPPAHALLTSSAKGQVAHTAAAVDGSNVA